jgi:hypothetical protein
VKASFKRYRVVLEAISPIHIGSGEGVEPWQYVLEPYEKSKYLWLLDVAALLDSLPEADRREFVRRCDSGNPLTARDWLAERFAKLRAGGDSFVLAVVQVSPGAYKELTERRADGNRTNEVQLFIRDDARAEPYLPGSSLKGVIRTALVAAAAAAADAGALQGATRAGRSSAAFEALALGHSDLGRDGKPRADLYRDPLRQLAFSDLTLPENSTIIERMKVLTATGPAGQGTGTDGIQMYREVTWSMLDKERIEAVGELRVHDRLTDSARAGSKKLPRTWDIAGLCRASNDFYKPVLTEEIGKFLASSAYRPILEQARDSLSETQCLVRMGRHSHFEAMTIPGFQQPPPKGFGKTRTYANGTQPLGWARLTFGPFEESL